MKTGALIIGDEIMSGKREDQHFRHLQSVLAQRGLELNWTILCGDDTADLQRFFTLTLASPDIVFCFGGIGATPDDRTRQSFACAANVPLVPHPEAVAAIEAQFGKRAYPKRILMAQLPEGSELIPNPINRVPGFSFQQHHFMPGFPEMAWPMIEWVLTHRYPDLQHTRPATEQSIYIYQGHEAELIDTMTAILTQFPELKLSSLPHMGTPAYIEFSLRGSPSETEQAMKLMTTAVEQAGYHWSTQPPVSS